MKSIEVVAAAIYKDGKVLAAQLGYGEFKGGWEFPGGKVEPGESLEEAIVREIQEEMETMIEVGEKIGTVEYDYPNFHLKMHCFWAKVKEGKFKLLEHDAVMWLDKKSIQTIQWLPADVELVEKVAKRLDYQS
jgi:8-oxo-dGTP diphosphatase